MKATATASRLQVLWKEPEDHQAVAASCHHDTPDTTSNPGQRRQQGLNNKLSAAAHCDVVLGRELLAEVPGNLPAPMLEVDGHLRLDDVLVVEWSGDYFYWSGVAPGFVSL
jgi:hypothetical protein